MPNAVVYIAVGGPGEVAPETFQSALAPVLRERGYTAGPWTRAVVTSDVRANSDGGLEIVNGPWAGELLSAGGGGSAVLPWSGERMPTGVTRAVTITAYKQIIRGDVSDTGLAALRTAIRAGTLAAVRGGNTVRFTHSVNYLGGAIAGDRGVPRTPDDTSSSTASGIGWAVLAAIGLTALGVQARSSALKGLGYTYKDIDTAKATVKGKRTNMSRYWALQLLRSEGYSDRQIERMRA